MCGRYEGVDQRVADHLCDGEVSIGDYVLAGGEVAAAVVIDAVSAPAARASWATRNRRARSRSPPACSSTRSSPGPPSSGATPFPTVLRSGDHARIARWRRAQSLHRTLARRPDLLEGRALTVAEEALLREFPANSRRPGPPTNIAGSSIPELSR